MYITDMKLHSSNSRNVINLTPSITNELCTYLSIDRG